MPRNTIGRILAALLTLGCSSATSQTKPAARDGIGSGDTSRGRDGGGAGGMGVPVVAGSDFGGSASGGSDGNAAASGGKAGASGGGAGASGVGGAPIGVGAAGGIASAGSGGAGGRAPSNDTDGSAAPTVNPVRYVFVIAMENHDGTSIYGNTAGAPYINGTLMHEYASASKFIDTLPLAVPSEPHYVWMEAGTNQFADYTFTSDDEPSASNSTSSKDHLVTQIDAKGGLSWLAYQEGIDGTSGACPIHASGFYQPKHDPFVFFQNVSGSPPSATNTYCAQHHRLLSALSQDLAQKKVANYNFVTPDQCHDMHGQFGCPSIDLVKPGDDWLAANLPDIISFCNANDGVVFVVWDEGESSDTIPFLAIGPGIKKGYSSSVQYTHSSLLKSVEEIFGLPILGTVTSANDFADLFLPGALP